MKLYGLLLCDYSLMQYLFLTEDLGIQWELPTQAFGDPDAPTVTHNPPTSLASRVKTGRWNCKVCKLKYAVRI